MEQGTPSKVFSCASQKDIADLFSSHPDLVSSISPPSFMVTRASANIVFRYCVKPRDPLDGYMNNFICCCIGLVTPSLGNRFVKIDRPFSDLSSPHLKNNIFISPSLFEVSRTVVSFPPKKNRMMYN